MTYCWYTKSYQRHTVDYGAAWSNEFFTLRNQPHLRGHKYVINKQRSFNMRRVPILATESLIYGTTCH